jgi:transposase
MYLEEIKRSDARRKALEHQMKALLTEIPLAEYILSLPGMGPVSCGIFLGELGNPEYFKNPRQIIKYAGYDPKENESGSRTGRKIISKKGRWLLRKCLYFMALQVVQRSSFFKEYYEHKQKGFVRPLEKKEALCAVILKLVRVLFALMRDRRPFTEKNGPLPGSSVKGGDNAVVEGGPWFLRRHKGLYDSAWSTSTHPFDLYKVSWA